MMLPHLKYLWYVLRHKWYVFRAGLVLGVPLWALIIHDWSKFSAAEWGPYVRRFFGGRGGVLDKAADPDEFNRAWAHHWQRNLHHPEYWKARAELMPVVYVREMVADWYGAGMAQGKPDCWGWYLQNRSRYPITEGAHILVTACLEVLEQRGLIPARGDR